jgi:hypothetical protein
LPVETFWQAGALCSTWGPQSTLIALLHNHALFAPRMSLGNLRHVQGLSLR